MPVSQTAIPRSAGSRGAIATRPGAPSDTSSSASSLADIGRWWTQQMRDLLPRGRVRAPRPMLAVLAGDGDMVAAVVCAGATPADLSPEAMIAARSLASDPVRLRAAAARLGGRIVAVVPDDALIETMIDLPASASAHLHDVARFEIDRLTPFRAEEVVFGCEIMQRARGRIAVRLALVPGSIAADAMEALREAGLRPRSIASRHDGRAIPLDRPVSRKARLRLGLVVAGCLVLAAAPFVRQQLALDRTAGAIDAIADQTHFAQGLRARIDRALHGPQALAADTRAMGSLPQILAHLSAALPDDTYLTGLSLKRRHLEFGGISSDAPALIGRMDGAGFANAALSGPVLRTPDGRRDVFAARADLPAPPP